MWYVVPHNKTIAEVLANNPSAFLNFSDARDKAEFLREKVGLHYHVIKLQTVWTTKTLDDLFNERGEEQRRKFDAANPTP